MISGATLRLVLLVSCAHALVHVFELSLPSVEQRIAADYRPNDELAGKRMTGLMSACWRLPWGLGALLAGWLVDRFGSKRMLSIYLLGCAVACGVAAAIVPLPILFVAMFSMGTLASIYHPAGLALISHETSAANRPRALGLHGIFGSAGIAMAPFLAWMFLSAGFGWRQYYAALIIPGAILGVVFLGLAIRDGSNTGTAAQRPAPVDQEHTDWRSFFTLTVLALMQGFVYSAVLSFLARYLSGWQPSWLAEWQQRWGGSLATGVLFSAGILLVGCIGQYIAGRIARPELLERQLALICFGNVPCLLWMAVAKDWNRPLAAALFALVHFMHQPIYNSLIAKYTPRHRRSLCYGFSFAMGLGIGGLGAYFAGQTRSDELIYTTLAIVATAAGFTGLILWRFASSHARTV